MRISSAPVEQVEPYGSKEILDFADLKASPHPRRPAYRPLGPGRPKPGLSLCTFGLLSVPANDLSCREFVCGHLRGVHA